MKRLLIYSFLLFSIIQFDLNAHAQVNMEVQLNSEESQLLKLINQDRLKHNLPVLKILKELQMVAREHVRDLTQHPPVPPCNLHSWSNSGNWVPVCYTPDHKEALKMWNKPKEIAGYPSEGFEIAYAHSHHAKPEEAMASWKKSALHYALIANLNQWKDNHWAGVGVAILGQYAVVWFAE